jgi:hypothetical protein
MHAVCTFVVEVQNNVVRVRDDAVGRRNQYGQRL